MENNGMANGHRHRSLGQSDGSRDLCRVTRRVAPGMETSQRQHPEGVPQEADLPVRVWVIRNARADGEARLQRAQQ